MIHHVSLGTNNLERARKFYDPVMEVLGLRLLLAEERSINYGVGDISFSIELPWDRGTAHPGNGIHVAFAARDRKMVQEFYAIALQNGGTDDGAPGLRPEYDENYYGAFIRDPDGNKIEAVTFSAV